MALGLRPESTAAPAALDPAPAVAASPVVENNRIPTPLGDDALPTLLEVVAASDFEDATARLFRLWNADYVAHGDPPCSQAGNQGLRCLPLEDASPAGIRALGVPAVVELRMPALLDFGPDGIARGTVLLPAHDASTAVTLEAEGKRRFDIDEFARVSTGKGLLLFRPAVTAAPGTLVEGARGVSVVWLRTVLAEIGGQPIVSSDPMLFDATLAAALRSFQEQRGLVADGIVTDLTLLSLQSAIGMAGLEPDAAER
jgi:hypothetical protein